MIKKFQGIHYGMISKWWKAHGMEAPKIHELPELGLIADDIAAGFLYKTDSSVCMIEALIANPEKPTGVRNEALDLVVTELCREAREMGFKKIYGFTRLESVLDRAVSHDFKSGGIWHLIAKEL